MSRNVQNRRKKKKQQDAHTEGPSTATWLHVFVFLLTSYPAESIKRERGALFLTE